MKKLSVIAACAALALCLAGCSSEAMEPDREISEIGEVTIDSYGTLQDINQRYEALDDKQKEQIENYAVLDEANNRMNEVLYSELIGAIETASSLETSFFTQSYDMTEFTSAKEAAQNAVSDSDEDSYYETLESLESEINALSAFIEAEKANSFSIQTNDGEYPFAVNESDMTFAHVLNASVKHSSEYPYEISFFEGSTTDEPTDMHFKIGNSNSGGCTYSVEIAQTDTTFIDVEIPGGEKKKALVNTEIVLSNSRNNWGQDNGMYPLEEDGSCYMFRSENGVMLAVKDIVSGSGYLTYTFW